MTSIDDQIQRIKTKIFEAKREDRYLKVFGAEQHRYVLQEPTTPEVVADFEAKYAVDLPEGYKAFVLTVGNGGVGYQESAAGPFYGIYPFGREVEELVYAHAEESLRKECLLFPEMSGQDWSRLIRQAKGSRGGGPMERELWAGILPLGSQGCTYLHGLVLNGPHRGRVVNIDAEMETPKFARDATFLDWYERWLDDVINGQLQKSTAGWFGYDKPGAK